MKRTFLMTAIIIMFIALFGCAQPADQPNANDELSHNPSVPPMKQQVDKPDKQDKQQPPTKEEADEHSAHISSPEPHDREDDESDEDVEPVTQDEDEEERDEQTVESEDPLPYNPAQPKLLGLTIGQPKQLIADKFGKPLEQYVMDDPVDPITVYEYAGFLIGYNRQQRIEFIDITAREIDSGLNGLRLGDPVEVAIQALGQPDTRTPYVLNYIAAGTILKLDLDPLANTVSSIKLFSAD